MSNDIKNIGEFGLIENKLFHRLKDHNPDVDYKIEKIFNYEDRLFVLFSRINKKISSDTDNSENQNQNCLYLFSIKKDDRKIIQLKPSDIPLELFEFLKEENINNFRIANLGNGTYKNSLLYNSKFFDYSFEEMTDDTNANPWSRTYRKLIPTENKKELTFFSIDAENAENNIPEKRTIYKLDNDSNGIDSYISQYYERPSSSSTEFGSNFGRVGTNDVDVTMEKYYNFTQELDKLKAELEKLEVGSELYNEKLKEINILKEKYYSDSDIHGDKYSDKYEEYINMDDTNRYLYNYEYFWDKGYDEWYVFNIFAFNDRIYSRDEIDHTKKGDINVLKLFPYFEETYLGGLKYLKSDNTIKNWLYHDNAFIKDNFLSSNIDDNYLLFSGENTQIEIDTNLLNDSTPSNIFNNFNTNIFLCSNGGGYDGYGTLIFEDNDGKLISNSRESTTEYHPFYYPLCKDGTNTSKMLKVYSCYNYKYNDNIITFDIKEFEFKNFFHNRVYPNFNMNIDKNNYNYLSDISNINMEYAIYKPLNIKELDEILNFTKGKELFIFNNFDNNYIENISEEELTKLLEKVNGNNISRIIKIEDNLFNIDILKISETKPKFSWKTIFIVNHNKTNSKRKFIKTFKIPYRIDKDDKKDYISRNQEDGFYDTKNNSEIWSYYSLENETKEDKKKICESFFIKNNKQLIDINNNLIYKNLVSLNWGQHFKNSSDVIYYRNCNFYDMYSDILEEASDYNINLDSTTTDDSTMVLQDSNIFNTVIGNNGDLYKNKYIENIFPQFYLYYDNYIDKRCFSITNPYYSILTYYKFNQDKISCLNDISPFNSKSLSNYKNKEYAFLLLNMEKNINTVYSNIKSIPENNILLPINYLNIKEYFQPLDLYNNDSIIEENYSKINFQFNFLNILSEFSSSELLFLGKDDFNNLEENLNNFIDEYNKYYLMSNGIFGKNITTLKVNFDNENSNFENLLKDKYNIYFLNKNDKKIIGRTLESENQSNYYDSAKYASYVEIENSNSIWFINNSDLNITDEMKNFKGYIIKNEDGYYDYSYDEEGYFLTEENNKQKIVFVKITNSSKEFIEFIMFSSIPIYKEKICNNNIGEFEESQRKVKLFYSYEGLNSIYKIEESQNIDIIYINENLKSYKDNINYEKLIKALDLTENKKAFIIDSYNRLYFIYKLNNDENVYYLYGVNMSLNINENTTNYEFNKDFGSNKKITKYYSEKTLHLKSCCDSNEDLFSEPMTFFFSKIIADKNCCYKLDNNTLVKWFNDKDYLSIEPDNNDSFKIYFGLYNKSYCGSTILTSQELFENNDCASWIDYEVTDKQSLLNMFDETSIRKIVPQLTSTNSDFTLSDNLRNLKTTNRNMDIVNKIKNLINTENSITVRKFFMDKILNGTDYTYYKNDSGIINLNNDNGFNIKQNVSYCEKYLGIIDMDNTYSLGVHYNDVISNFNLAKSNDENFSNFFSIKDYAMIPLSNTDTSKFTFLTNDPELDEKYGNRRQITILKNNEIIKLDLMGYTKSLGGESYKKLFKFLSENNNIYSEYIDSKDILTKVYLTNKEIESELTNGKFIDLVNLLNDKIPFTRFAFETEISLVKIFGKEYKLDSDHYIKRDNKEFFIDDDKTEYLITIKEGTNDKYVNYKNDFNFKINTINEEEEYYFILKNNNLIVSKLMNEQQDMKAKILAVVNFTLPNGEKPDIMMSGVDKGILIVTKDFYTSEILEYENEKINDKKFLISILFNRKMIETLDEDIRKNKDLEIFKNHLFTYNLLSKDSILFTFDSKLEETSIIDENVSEYYNIDNQRIITENLNRIDYIKLYDITEKERMSSEERDKIVKFRLFAAINGRVLVSNSLFDVDESEDYSIISIEDFYQVNGNVNEIYVEEVDIDNNNFLLIATDRSELYIFDNLFAYKNKYYNNKFVDYTFGKNPVLKNICIKYNYNFTNEFKIAEDGRKLYRETHNPKILYIGSSIDGISICDKYINTLNSEYVMEDGLISLKNSIKYFKLKNDLEINNDELNVEGEDYQYNGELYDDGSYIKLEKFVQNSKDYNIATVNINNNKEILKGNNEDGNIFMINLRIRLNNGLKLEGSREYRLNMSLYKKETEIIGLFNDRYVLNHYSNDLITTDSNGNLNYVSNYIRFEEDGIYKNIYFFLPKNCIKIESSDDLDENPYIFKDFKILYNIIDTDFINEFTNLQLTKFPSRLTFRDFFYLTVDNSKDYPESLKEDKHSFDNKRLYFRYRYIGCSEEEINDIKLIVSTKLSIKENKEEEETIFEYVTSEDTYDKKYYNDFIINSENNDFKWGYVDIDNNVWKKCINGNTIFKFKYVITVDNNYKEEKEILLDLSLLNEKIITNDNLGFKYEDIEKYFNEYERNILPTDYEFIFKNISIPDKLIYNKYEVVRDYIKDKLNISNYEEFEEYLYSKISEKENITNRRFYLNDGSFSFVSEDFIKNNSETQNNWIKENYMPLKTTLFNEKVPLNINERLFNGTKFNIYNKDTGVIDLSQKLDDTLHYSEEKRLIPSVYVNGLKMFNQLFSYKDNLNNSESIYLPFNSLTQYVLHTNEHPDLQTLYKQAKMKLTYLDLSSKDYNSLTDTEKETLKELESILNGDKSLTINLEPSLTNIEVETKFGDIGEEEKLLCTIKIDCESEEPDDVTINGFKQVNVRRIVESLNGEGAYFITSPPNPIIPEDDNELSLEITGQNPNIFLDSLTLVFNEINFKEDFLRNFVNGSEINIYISYNDENNKYARRINPKFVNIEIIENTNDVQISIKGFYQYKNISHIYVVTGNIINHNLFFANIDKEIEYIELADIVTDRGNQIFKFLSYDEIVNSKDLEIIMNGYTLYPNIDYTILNSKTFGNENIIIFRDIVPGNGNISAEINLLPNNTSEFVFMSKQAHALKKESIESEGLKLTVYDRFPISKYITLDNDKYQFLQNNKTKKFSLFINNRKVPSDLIEIKDTKTINLSKNNTDYAIDYRKTNLAEKINKNNKEYWISTDDYTRRNDGVEYRAFDPPYENIMIVFQKSDNPYNYEININKKYEKNNFSSLMSNLLIDSESCYTPKNTTDIYDNFDWLCESNGGSQQNINNTLKLNALFNGVSTYNCNINNLGTDIVLDGEFFENENMKDNIYIDCNENVPEE